MLSGEYCEIFKNTYFEKHLPTAASEKKLVRKLLKRRHLTQGNNLTTKREYTLTKIILKVIVYTIAMMYNLLTEHMVVIHLFRLKALDFV